jgi:hypothetical protein
MAIKNFIKKDTYSIIPNVSISKTNVSFNLVVYENESKNNVMFITPLLIYNPMINILTKIITYGNEPQILKYKNIVKFLKENKRNISVCAGGFAEMNMYNNDIDIIYTKRWKFWIKQAIIYGYNISVTYVYNGNKDYEIIPIFSSFKKWCAKNYIPFNIFYGKLFWIPFNDFTMYDFTVGLELPYNPEISNEEVNIYYYK